MLTNYKDCVAIIPARGGSKGVPGKNLKVVGGDPLLVRAIKSCRAVSKDLEVFVSTDDPEIAILASKSGAHVIHRPTELATDQASSESALLHAVGQIKNSGRTPKVIAFLQATSPFIPSDSLGMAISRVLLGEFDVVFSAFESHSFLWRRGVEGMNGVNHELSFRPRRQDRESNFVETGAFYVMNTEGFLLAQHRFFGRIDIELVPEKWSLEIDTQEELEWAQRIAPEFDREPRDFSGIKALVMDFDGVHTDDHAWVFQDGTEAVRVSRSDGMGIESLKKAGFALLILSKEKNPVVLARAEKLGVPALVGIDEKFPMLANWAESQGLELSEIAYVGNDVNDAECLAKVGLSIVPVDCHQSVKHLARLNLRTAGGSGAIREVADALLNARQSEMLGN